MRTISVYGPPICGGCTFTLRGLQSKFKNTDVVVEKVVTDDSHHQAIIAAKLAVKAVRLNMSIKAVEPLTESEIAQPLATPFVFVDDIFVWNGNLPHKIDELYERFQKLTYSA